MKNILIIDDNLPYLLNNINFPVGGATVQTRNWMQGFEKLGYNIIICSSVAINNSSEYFISTISFSKYLIGKLSIFSIAYRYYKILKKVNPKFVYVSIPWWSNFLIFVPAKILKIKIIQRISNDNLVNNEAKSRFDNKIKYFLYKFSLGLTNVFLCQNDYQLDILKKKYPNKIVDKLYNPFFIKKEKELEGRLRNYVAWIGIFQHQKNLPALLTIAQSLPNVEFKLAGVPLSIIDIKTEKALKKLEKIKNVEFVGLLKRNEIHKFLSNAFCLLNTSHIEGFSNTYLEAFSAGTPVITRHKTDPDGIILKYNLGETVEDYSELPMAVERLINKKIDSEHLKKYLFKNHDSMLLAEKLIKIVKN